MEKRQEKAARKIERKQLRESGPAEPQPAEEPGIVLDRTETKTD